MAQNASNIHIGMARIWLGVTAPATGTPPTMLAHTDGVPATGTEAGYTQGESEFSYAQEKNEIEAEQSLNPVDVYVTTERATLTFTALEHVYNTLKTAFDNTGSVDDANKTLFYGGDASGLQSVTTQTVALTSRLRNAPTKFEVLVLYKVFNAEGIKIAYGRTSEAVYAVSLTALVDTTRNVGDRIFQWFREK
jgi:hypothetical protein